MLTLCSFLGQPDRRRLPTKIDTLEPNPRTPEWWQEEVLDLWVAHFWLRNNMKKAYEGLLIEYVNSHRSHNDRFTLDCLSAFVQYFFTHRPMTNNDSTSSHGVLDLFLAFACMLLVLTLVSCTSLIRYSQHRTERFLVIPRLRQMAMVWVTSLHPKISSSSISHRRNHRLRRYVVHISFLVSDRFLCSRIPNASVDAFVKQWKICTNSWMVHPMLLAVQRARRNSRAQQLNLIPRTNNRSWSSLHLIAILRIYLHHLQLVSMKIFDAAFSVRWSCTSFSFSILRMRAFSYVLRYTCDPNETIKWNVTHFRPMPKLLVPNQGYQTGWIR